jgi:tetratricopeptide (TPR) repeat protein/SAM-dependent methyltransferase
VVLLMNRKQRRASGPRNQQASDAVAPLFTLAVRHHQAGQLDEAANLYRQMLAIDREHFGSLHHLGIIDLQRGQPQLAVEVIGRALAVNDRIADCQYNMAFALQSLGRLDDAIAPYEAAIRLKPDYIEAHTNLGNVLAKLGRNGDALRAYERVIALRPGPEAHYNLASALAALGRLDAAETHFRRALALAPELVGAHNNLANALVAQGRLDEAQFHFQRAIELDPARVEAHVNLGTTLIQQKRLEEAAAQFQRATEINPGFADAYSHLGNVLLAQGRVEEAAQHYARVLELKPDLASAHNDLGIVLRAQGKFEEAGRRFEEALVCKPDFIDAYNNLAGVFLSLGLPDHALGALRRALAITETNETKWLFVYCVGTLAVPPDIEDFRALLIRALSEPWGRPSELSRIVAAAVKQDRALRSVIARVLEAWPRRLAADALFGVEGFAAFSRNRLLRCLMDAAIVADIELERVLTSLRAAMLEIAAADDATLAADEHVLDFCCALARQCYLNEQVFALTDLERGQAERLREAVSVALAAGAPIPELRLAAVAAYFPLHSLPGAQALLCRTWSLAVTDLLAQQIREPLEERQLRATLPLLTAIEDDVSSRVRQQYEENPYPRWRTTEPPRQPLSFCGYLRGRLPATPFRSLEKAEIDILVAGCGSGQHAIEIAQLWSGASVLAVDLSLASLAYAARKTRALGLTNITYGQADILALGSLGRSFDLIEVVGVLHHLADPLAGWRVLLSLLRPGGFMRVGLYSEIARAEIVGAHALIAEHGYRINAEDIRRCRQALMSVDGGRRFPTITTCVDFFSTSSCRDLLFHVQEHRFRIPQIAKFLAETGLTFLGFDLNSYSSQKYLTRFPHDKTMTDLGCWDRFERDNPNTFFGMYLFWVQKNE